MRCILETPIKKINGRTRGKGGRATGMQDRSVMNRGSGHFHVAFILSSRFLFAHTFIITHIDFDALIIIIWDHWCSILLAFLNAIFVLFLFHNCWPTRTTGQPTVMYVSILKKVETYFFVIVKNVKYKIQGLWKLRLNIYIRISLGNGILSETFIYSVT